MTSSPAEVSAFLERAVREEMISAIVAEELAAKASNSKLTISKLCVDEGKLKPIEAECIEGLLDPHSVAEGYEVEGLLGHGGIGIVYRARQPSLERLVALKTISATRLGLTAKSSRQIAIARFQQEAIAIAKLHHPNIVTAYDSGSTDDRIYLAMEMIEGTDLDAYILDRERVEVLTAWRIAKQVAAALAHAFESGIIHRDIKPANLLVTKPPAGFELPLGTPLVKVTDFGLARLAKQTTDRDEERLTGDGATMGTPHYMAPEQVVDSDVGFEADVYALGATIFHMMAGKPPFGDLPIMKVFTEKMSGAEPDFNALPNHVTGRGKRLLLSMLSHRPENRPRTYKALIAGIDDILNAGDDLNDNYVGIGPRDEKESVHFNQTIDLPPRVKKRVWLAPWGLAIAAVVLLLMTAIVWWQPWVSDAAPTTSFVENPELNAPTLLYRGRGVEGWQGVAQAAEAEYAGMLKVLGNARTDIYSHRERMVDPEHFAISMRVAVDSDSALEIWFEQNDRGGFKALRIENGQATIGWHEGERSNFEPLGDPVDLMMSTVAPNPVIQLDRDETHWIIRQSVPGEPPPPRLLAWTPIEGKPMDELRLKSDGDSVHVGEIELIPLVNSNELE